MLFQHKNPFLTAVIANLILLLYCAVFLINETTLLNANLSQTVCESSAILEETTNTLSKQPLLKIPTPIFVLSLPKSGTTSMFHYFSCGKVRSMHHLSKLPPHGTVGKVGYCFGKNVRNNRPMLENCGNYSVWSDAGVPRPKSKCFYPSMHGLENIERFYPNATIILGVRNTMSWTHSAMNWSGGSLVGRWKRNCNGFPRNATTQPSDWMTFYDRHTESIRTFAYEHPSITYIEFSLESPFVGKFLEEKTGLPEKCWGVANKRPKLTGGERKT